jgi:hypothetical protein
MAKLSSLFGGIETGTPLVPRHSGSDWGLPHSPGFDIGWKRNKLIPDHAPQNFWTKYEKQVVEKGAAGPKVEEYLPPFREVSSLRHRSLYLPGTRQT